MQHEDQPKEQLNAEINALKQQVAALQAKERELTKTLGSREREIQALLGVAPNPVIARYDRQLRHTYVNAAVRLATNIPPAAYIGKTSREMGMPDSVAADWEAALLKVFENAAEELIDYNVLVAGKKWYFQSHIFPEPDQNGIVESVIAITRDVTPQKTAEVDLLEYTEILEIVHDVGQVLSGELDLQKLVQEVTDAATEVSGAEFGAFFYNLINDQGESYMLYTLSGVPREAFSSFPMPRNTELFGPTFRGEVTVRIDDVRNDPRFGKNSPHYGMPKGHLPVTSYLAVPVVSRTHEVLGGLFFGHSQAGIFTQRDARIIEGLAAQAAIAIDNARLYQESRAQQERLRTTLASIGDAVIATDPRGHISFMNVVAQALTGWTDQEAIGKPLDVVFRIVNEFTREPAENPVFKVIRENRIVGLANHTLLLAKDGREIPIDDSGAPIRNIEGALVGVILVFRDITERKRHEQRNTLLLELSTAFSKALTQQQIAEVIVEQALKSLGGIVGTVAVVVENGTMLEVLNLSGLPAHIIEQYRRTPLDFPGPINDAVRAGDILWVENFEDYIRRYPHFENDIRRNRSRSIICIPLKIDEKVIGGFSLSFPVEKPRNSDEEAFFQTLAYLCAQSLERARLYEAEQQARSLSEALRDTMTALNSTIELSEVFDQILDNIDRVVRHDVADIMLIEGDVARVVRSHRYAEHGLAKSEADMQNFRLNIAETYHLNWIGVHKRPWIIEDTRTYKNWIKAHEPDLIRSTLIVPILINGEIVGFLNVDSLTPNFYTTSDAERLQTFAEQAAAAIRNARFYQAGLELAAQDERQRIARELHDAVSQSLFSANMIAEALPRIWERQPEKALAQVRLLHQFTQAGAAEMRLLLVELRPESLIRTSLSELLPQLSRAFQGQKNIDLSVIIQGTRGKLLSPEVQIAFYRIAQESLNNILKHTQAQQARIRLNWTDAQVSLSITDNGDGFDITQLSGGIGLKSMQERADSIHAVLDVRSKVGWGTRIKLTWQME